MRRAVFGMGVALVNNWPIIKENYNPQIGIDNNSAKWGKVDGNTGLMCKSLEEAKKLGELEVLITVGDPYIIELISSQLREKKIPYKVLIDVLDEWCQNAQLPEHLISMKKDERKIVLFNTPSHDNVGDHLITLSELDFLNKYFNDYKIYEVTDIEYLWYHKKLKELLSVSDIILVTGGGYLGSLWLYNGEKNVRNIINEYPDNRIIILPQTIFFENNIRGKREFEESLKIYGNHKKLTLCAREEESYNKFISMMNNSDNIFLLPDIGLLYKNFDINKEKNNHTIVICLRRDKERVLDDDNREKIKSNLGSTGYEIKEISMHSGDFSGITGRKGQVNEKLVEIASAELVVTDTLHCMISAALVGTTCIAFDNLSGKVGNVYKWIDNLDYIYFCRNMQEFKSVLPSIKLGTHNYYLKEQVKYELELEKIIRGL